MIIETSLRDIKRMPGKGRRNKDEKGGGSVKAQTEQRNKLTRFDPRNVKGNIELFQHINEPTSKPKSRQTLSRPLSEENTRLRSRNVPRILLNLDLGFS
jgi:hypothetical protein